MSAIYVLLYVMAAMIVGIAAIPGRLGLLGGFLLSLVLTPVVGAAIVLVFELLRPASPCPPEQPPSSERRKAP